MFVRLRFIPEIGIVSTNTLVTENKSAIDSAEALAKALGQAVYTAGEWRALCPAHDDHTPSLSITEKRDGMILFNCQSRGCSQAEVIAALASRGLWPFAHRAGSASTETEPAIDGPIQPDPAATALWAQSVPAPETKVQAYLRSRGLLVDPPPSLRFCSHYIYRPGDGAPSMILPAMVAALQAPDRQVIAVQVTALDRLEDRKYADKNSRRVHGAQGTGAVRLAPAGEKLGIAEGIEDALGAMQLTGIPCWACLGAARMHRVEFPTTVEEVHIFADDDDAGRRSSERTAELQLAVGRRVIIRRPPEGLKDWAAFAEQQTKAPGEQS
jgi:hypothetical protein